MSKNALILERTPSEAPLFTAPARELPRSGDYLDLIRQHFHTRSAVAIVAVGSGQGAGDVCDNLAAELAASGNRVVIVAIEALLRMNPEPPPDESRCSPGRTPNVWRWPSTSGGQLEFFKSHSPADPAANWLDSLRVAFDSVLLDCPATETAPAAAQLAAMADAALLVVEASRTTRHQVQHDQRALQLRGVKLAGCILIERKK
jgi:Mrp family chromosome partitioning ATPase